MPSHQRPSTSGSGKTKNTLSDSEVLAYSKNRFADRDLRHRVRTLSDQEQMCHDRHQREIDRWRDFIRQSNRTSGVWSPSFGSHDSSEDWGQGQGHFEDYTDSGGDPHRREHFGSNGSSPQHSPKRMKNASFELARCLTFQNEALGKLQKPWAYTFSPTSHNSLYNEAEILARGQEKRLYLRRLSSGHSYNSLSSSDHFGDKDALRGRASVSDLRQDSNGGGGGGFGSKRPLTGRSTPGIPLKSRSREKLSVTASVNKDRPQTSVGLVRVKPKLKKSSCVDKDDGEPGTFTGDGSNNAKSKEINVNGLPNSDLQTDCVTYTNLPFGNSESEVVFDFMSDGGCAVLTGATDIDKDKLPALGDDGNGIVSGSLNQMSHSDIDSSSKTEQLADVLPTDLNQNERDLHGEASFVDLETQPNNASRTTEAVSASPKRQRRTGVVKRVQISFDADEIHNDESTYSDANPDTNAVENQERSQTTKAVDSEADNGHSTTTTVKGKREDSRQTIHNLASEIDTQAEAEPELSRPLSQVKGETAQWSDSVEEHQSTAQTLASAIVSGVTTAGISTSSHQSTQQSPTSAPQKEGAVENKGEERKRPKSVSYAVSKKRGQGNSVKRSATPRGLEITSDNVRSNSVNTNRGSENITKMPSEFQRQRSDITSDAYRPDSVMKIKRLEKSAKMRPKSQRLRSDVIDNVSRPDSVMTTRGPENSAKRSESPSLCDVTNDAPRPKSVLKNRGSENKRSESPRRSDVTNDPVRSDTINNSVTRHRGLEMVDSPRQRVDVTSDVFRSDASAPEIGSLSRRYSEIDERRRGSFMKIVDHLEALREHNNNRRMIRIDDDKEDLWEENEVFRSPNEANANLTNGKEAVSDVKDAHLLRSRNGVTGAVASGKKSKSLHGGRKSEHKPTILRFDPIDEASRGTKPHHAVNESPQSEKNKTSNRIKSMDVPDSKTPTVEPISEHPHYVDTTHPHPQNVETKHPDPIFDDTASFYPSDRSCSGDSSYTVFNGYPIRNYIRPQDRYRVDPLLVKIRERPMMILKSMENPACLNGQREVHRSETIFSKTARKKVLRELVDRNNQPMKAEEGGVVPPQLRAKIDDFFKTIEPFCPPKSDVKEF